MYIFMYIPLDLVHIFNGIEKNTMCCFICQQIMRLPFYKQRSCKELIQLCFELAVKGELADE
jgi:hypothetical protein